MSYDRDIIFILNEAGPKGLSVKKIARHVYNHNNGFFNVVSFEDVYRYVSSYLIRTSKVPDSIIEKTDERGVYRINNSSKMSLQLQFVKKPIPQVKSLKLIYLLHEHLYKRLLQ